MCLKKLYVLEQLELIFVIFGAQYPENHSFLSIGSKHTLTPSYILSGGQDPDPSRIYAPVCTSQSVSHFSQSLQQTVTVTFSDSKEDLSLLAIYLDAWNAKRS